MTQPISNAQQAYNQPGFPQQASPNAVSINIYNPQAYGSAPNGTCAPQQAVQQPPYNYTNSFYQIPQANAYQQPQQAVQQPPYNYTNSFYQIPQANAYQQPQQAPEAYQQYMPVQSPVANAYQQPQQAPEAYQQYMPVQSPVANAYQQPQQAPEVYQQYMPVQSPVANAYQQPQQAPEVYQQYMPVQSPVAPAPQIMPDSVMNQPQRQPTVGENQTQVPQEINNGVDATNTTEETPQAANNEATTDASSEAQNANNVNVDELVAGLADTDTDKKAQTINQIAEYAQANPSVALQVVSEPVMNGLINVINEDTTGLEGPTEEQIAIADKITKGEQLTPEEDALSEQLSPRDKANKNRIFALYTLAMIQKLQREELNQYIENQKANGEQPVEPLKIEELPGYNDVVNVIKNDSRPEVKVAAMQALQYIAEPEDKASVEAALSEAVNSEDEIVKAAAQEVLDRFTTTEQTDAQANTQEQQAEENKEGQKAA